MCYLINILYEDGTQALFSSEIAFTLYVAMEWVEIMRYWAMARYPQATHVELRHPKGEIELFPI